MKSFAQILLFALALTGSSITFSGNITVDITVGNKAVLIKEKSFIDTIKKLVEKHKTIALSIAGTVIVVSAATMDHLFLNGTIRNAFKKGLVSILPFLPKETTQSKEINDQEWTTGQKVGATAATIVGIGGIIYMVKKRLKPTLPPGCRNNASQKELAAGDGEFALAEIEHKEKITLLKADQLLSKPGSNTLWSETTLKNMEILGYPRMHHLTEESIEKAFAKRLTEYPERREIIIKARDGLIDLLFVWKRLKK